MSQHWQPVIVAPEVAQRIRDRVLAGQSLGDICDAEHMDPREVRAVLYADAVAPPLPLEPGPLTTALLDIVDAARHETGPARRTAPRSPSRDWSFAPNSA